MNGIWSRLCDTLKRLEEYAREGRLQVVSATSYHARADETSDWDGCELLLACLPLPTDQYAYLSCRLTNAKRYSLDGLFGASVYEIILVTRRIERLRPLYV